MITKEGKQAHALVQELEIGARKVCVNNKLHRNLDYYLWKPQNIYYE